MAKTKTKKTMEQKKLDALLAIGKTLAGIEKLMADYMEERASDMNMEVDDD